MKDNKIVPIFYACDDNFVKYTIVSLRSLIDNADKNRRYEIYVLNSSISDGMKEETYKLKTDNVNVTFVDVKEQLDRIGKRLPLLLRQFQQAVYMTAYLLYAARPYTNLTLLK